MIPFPLSWFPRPFSVLGTIPISQKEEKKKKRARRSRFQISCSMFTRRGYFAVNPGDVGLNCLVARERRGGNGMEGKAIVGRRDILMVGLKDGWREGGREGRTGRRNSEQLDARSVGSSVRPGICYDQLDSRIADADAVTVFVVDAGMITRSVGVIINGCLFTFRSGCVRPHSSRQAAHFSFQTGF